MALKHVGKMKHNGAKVLVVYRTLPAESDNALVVGTANLTADQHDSIMKVVESAQGQDSFELGNILGRRYFPDGRIILNALHTEGKLKRVGTSEVIMTPTTTSNIVLDELNQMIAEQRGISVNDLAVSSADDEEVQELGRVNKVETPKESTPQAQNAPLSDEDLAKSYRSQADAMYKEAKRLRDEAEKLSPTKKATKTKDEVSA
jgi:hypothetical protein